MFTGIVQSIGLVARLDRSGAGARLAIDPGSWRHEARPGDSICVAGCCLTLAAAADGGLLAFDVVGETLARTTLGSLGPGARVNLEASLRPDAPIGGHFVQGHIDGVGTVAAVRDAAADRRLAVRAPPDLLDCIVPKGSIGLDGVSLTIATVREDVFEIALIPTTLDRTTLGSLAVGDACNVETDIIARTVAHILGRRV